MCSLLASRPLNNLRYTEHLTEMRQHWLTDTSISLAIYLTEEGKRSRVSHAWRREHCLLVRGDREWARGGGWRGWRGDGEIASSQFRFDEGHSVFLGWAEIYVMLSWLRLQKRSVKMCRDFKWSAHAILLWYRDSLSSPMGSYIPFIMTQNRCYVSNRLFCGWPVCWVMTCIIANFQQL